MDNGERLNQKDLNVWGEVDKWSDPNVRHQLLISGIPESGGFVSEKNRLDDCLNKKDTAFLQLYSDTYFMNIEAQTERLANVLNHAGGKVEIVGYSAGAYVLANLLKKYPEYADKIEFAELINPSIGGKSINMPIMERFYPKTKEVIGGLGEVWDKLNVTISKKDGFVNSKFVEETFGKLGKTVEWREGNHTIDDKVVNGLFKKSELG